MLQLCINEFSDVAAACKCSYRRHSRCISVITDVMAACTCCYKCQIMYEVMQVHNLQPSWLKPVLKFHVEMTIHIHVHILQSHTQSQWWVSPVSSTWTSAACRVPLSWPWPANFSGLRSYVRRCISSMWVIYQVPGNMSSVEPTGV